MNDQSALKEAVAGYITAVGKRSSSLQEYHYFIMNLVSELFRFTIHNQLNPDEVLGDSDVLYRRIQQMEIPKLEEWLYEVCIGCRRKSGTSVIPPHAPLLPRVGICAGYYSDQNLTSTDLQRARSQRGLFSTVFKKQTGRPLSTT